MLGHTASMSLNYTSNKDLNPYANGETDVQTMAFGLSYSMDAKPIETNFTLSFSHQDSKGFSSHYRSDVFSLGASRSFLKEKNLNFSGTLSLCYNEIKRQSKSLSMGCDLSANYTYKEAHMFSASAGFNKYGDVNITKKRSSLDCTDISISFNYAYTFTLLAIKSKANKAKK